MLAAIPAASSRHASPCGRGQEIGGGLGPDGGPLPRQVHARVRGPAAGRPVVRGQERGVRPGDQRLQGRGPARQPDAPAREVKF